MDVHDILILIAYASNEGSDEPVYMRRLVRAIAARTLKAWKT